jgi:4a-hydroxytetrahydrobiopterin dehydratase
MDLSDRTCVACEGGVPPLTEAEYAPLLAQLPGWSVERDKRLVRSFRFPTYPRTIAFVNAVAAVAEEEGHHPNLSVAWGKVGVTL